MCPRLKTSKDKRRREFSEKPWSRFSVALRTIFYFDFLKKFDTGISKYTRKKLKLMNYCEKINRRRPWVWNFHRNHAFSQGHLLISFRNSNFSIAIVFRVVPECLDLRSPRWSDNHRIFSSTNDESANEISDSSANFFGRIEGKKTEICIDFSIDETKQTREFYDRAFRTQFFCRRTTAPFLLKSIAGTWPAMPLKCPRGLNYSSLWICLKNRNRT